MAMRARGDGRRDVNDVLRTGENRLEGRLDVRGVLRRRLDERQAVLSCKGQGKGESELEGGHNEEKRRTGEVLALLRGDSSQMLQITLVANEHDDDVRVGVVPELLQPPYHVHICCVFSNVVHQQRANCASVVASRCSVRYGTLALIIRGDCSRRRDRSVSLLTSCTSCVSFVNLSQQT